jgi:hypothetical protein
VLGKDLATGQTFAVATGSTDQSTPTIAGRSVAWLEANGVTQRLLLGSLDDTIVQTITSLPAVGPNGYSLGRPLLSDDYLVWEEIAPASHGAPGPTLIRAFNRHSGQIRTIETVPAAHPSQATPAYALSGHRLVWVTTALHLDDLDTDSTRVLYSSDYDIYSPLISGDTVLWSAYRDGNYQVFGLQLGEGTPRVLVRGQGMKISPVVAGDRLAWANLDGPYRGQITIASLAAAFAGSTVVPNPAAPPLAIPAPAPGMAQRLAVANDQYLAWAESPVDDYRQTVLRAVDLRTSTVISVTTTPASIVVPPVLSGNLLIWLESQSCAPGCDSTVRTYDLARQEPVISPIVVAGGLAAHNGMLAFIQNNSLLLVGPPHAEAQGVANLPAAGPIRFGALALSDEYLLWDEMTPVGPHTFSHTVHGVPLSGGLVAGIAQTITTGDSVENFEMALDGGQLIWTDRHTHLMDLATRTSRQVGEGVVFAPAISGDTAVWASYSGLMGINATHPTAVRLVDYSVPPVPTHPVLAGPWLVWEKTGHLVAGRLAELFARAAP